MTEISYKGSQRPAWYEGLAGKVQQRYITLRDGFTFNFDQMTWTPLTAAPLLLLGMATLFFIGLQVRSRSLAAADSWNWAGWIARIGWAALLVQVLVNEFFVARFLSTDGSLMRSTILDIRTLQAILLLTGLVMLLRKKQIAAFLRRLIVQLGRESGDSSSQNLRNANLFALALVIPWLSLISVVEAGNTSRYWWLWPVQLVAVVAAVTYIPERLRLPRTVTLVGQTGLTLVLLAHPWLASPVQAWVTSGWSGPKAGQLQALDYLASQVRAEGRNEVALGYQTLFYDFMPAFNAVEPRYKVAGELDQYLNYRHGISNSNQCAEGLSSEDEYLIVQTAPKPIAAADPNKYFNIPSGSQFRMVRQFGDYQVFQRVESLPKLN
jgi:hypothetical protein